jgi:hypothetical protein
LCHYGKRTAVLPATLENPAAQNFCNKTKTAAICLSDLTGDFMLCFKFINAADNVVFATHVLPPLMWPEAVKYNLAGLGQIGRIISLTNPKFPFPPEFQPYSPVVFSSLWGELNLKKALDFIDGKKLYFTGGNMICCLANTIKSLYGLPKLLDQNLTFTLLKDYIWAVNFGYMLTIGQYLTPAESDKDRGVKVIPERQINFLSYSLTYWHMRNSAFLPPGNAAKRSGVNIFLHYQGRTYTLYESKRSKWRIDLEVCKLSEVGRTGH